MKHKATLGVMIAFAAAAPAVVVPQLVAQAQAQDAAANVDRAEYPDVPRGHWAYDAIDKLSRAGVIEGRPDGGYHGNQAMTRYEFAVAIARLINTLGDRTTPVIGPVGPQGERGPQGEVGPPGNTINMADYMTRQDINDLIAALRREFADELARLGIRVSAAEDRISALENRVTKPARLTITPSILWRGGTANYITQRRTPGIGGFGGVDDGPHNGQLAPNIFTGRNVVNYNGRFGAGFVGGVGPGGVVPDQFEGLPSKPTLFFHQSRTARTNAKYSYTDFEVRMTDRISDRLSLNAALRSLGSTQEDPWAGESVHFETPPAGNELNATSNGGSGIYVREANAVADLSDRRPLGIRGLTAIIGRQRTKNALGLLYDNDLAPTDQAHLMFNIGPLAISGFNGTTNNQVFAGSNNPYTNTGAVRYLGTYAPGFGTPGNGSQIGFPGMPNAGAFPEDNESLVHVGFNLFRIAGQPVSIGASRLFDGYQNQTGDSVDLSLPLFNRTIGFEWVRGRQYANGAATNGDDRPTAYYVTAPLLRTRFLDLNAAYGKAEDNFEYFVSSSANPFARTYSEAIFDRPMFLGAPMINGRGNAGEPLYMAAKQGYDFNGTVRIPFGFLKRFPIDFRYYKAKGSDINGQSTDLGQVYSIGSSYSLSPGIDLNYKFGEYDSGGQMHVIRYVRVGVNVGF